jgi:hypothetical protein
MAVLVACYSMLLPAKSPLPFTRPLDLWHNLEFDSCRPLLSSSPLRRATHLGFFLAAASKYLKTICTTLVSYSACGNLTYFQPISIDARSRVIASPICYYVNLSRTQLEARSEDGLAIQDWRSIPGTLDYFAERVSLLGDATPGGISRAIYRTTLRISISFPDEQPSPGPQI